MKTKKILLSCFLIGTASFVQIVNAQTNLVVNDLKAKTGEFSQSLSTKNLGIQPSDDGSGSHIYTYHKLTIGAIGYAHNEIEIRSAGGPQGPTYTSLGLFATPTPSTPQRIVFFNTSPNSKSYINSGYLGVNTTNPTKELEVNGTIKTKGLELTGAFEAAGDITTSGNIRLGTVAGQMGYSKKLYFGKEWDNTDDAWIARFNESYNRTQLRVNIGDDLAGDDAFMIGTTTADGKEYRNHFVVRNNGKVGINGVASPYYELDVNGTIRANEVRVETGWADFVFAKDYKLPTLEEVKAHIEEHKHLPGIPSEKEVKENGIGIAEIATKMMQKIEELTLYTIQQQETIQTLSKKIDELENSK